MIWECIEYHDEIDRLISHRNDLVTKRHLTPDEEEELRRHVAQLSELSEINRMNKSTEHEFITDPEDAIGFIHDGLDRLERIQGNKMSLLYFRREMNRKLIHGALMDYKRVLQNAWYEVFAALDETIYRICKSFIDKLRPLLQTELESKQAYFDFWYTPYHSDFKYLLGKYVLSKKGAGLDAEDYLFLYDRKLTGFGSQNLHSILVFLQEELDAFENKNGFSLMASHLDRYKTDDFKRMKKLKRAIQAITRIAENRARRIKELPNVGEGWLGETELFNAIRERLKHTEVIHNGSPSFLGRQHLDVWIPKMKVGVEYQGEQHFRPVDFFGGKDAFESILRRDEKKRSLCSENKVTIIYVRDGYDFEQVMAMIMNRDNKPGI